MRPLSAFTIATLLAAAASPAAWADEATCQVILDAVVKQAALPVHQKISIESAAAPGRTIESELIHLDGTTYMQMRGKWITRPYDKDKAVADARAAMMKAEHSCSRVRSEAVDGQSATLYSVQARTENGGSESQIWIASATGLPLRQQTEFKGAAAGRHEVRFDYANVKAPDVSH